MQKITIDYKGKSYSFTEKNYGKHSTIFYNDTSLFFEYDYYFLKNYMEFCETYDEIMEEIKVDTVENLMDKFEIPLKVAKELMEELSIIRYAGLLLNDVWEENK